MSDDNENIDLNFRPPSRLFPLPAEKFLLSTIKGETRRRLAQEAIDNGSLKAVPEVLLKSALDEDERRSFGRIHPSHMGGEYLPERVDAEIEVARININSTTSDVTSVYARIENGNIWYRVVDEYEGDTITGASELASQQPLTLKELADFFLEAWKLEEVLEMNELDEASSQDFVHPSSEFYPQFEKLIRQKIRGWRHRDDEEDE